MNSIDELWQRLIDEACARWRARPTDELKALPQCTQHKARSNTDEVEYVLWHDNPEEGHNVEFHSFVLQANRNLGLIFRRNYFAGFALDENGAVIPIADDVISRYD